jgi:hypothetical protein
MRSTRIPLDELRALHSRLGDGEGTIGFEHIPTGIVVTRRCEPNVPVQRHCDDALRELERQLDERGLLDRTP